MCPPVPPPRFAAVIKIITHARGEREAAFAEPEVEHLIKRRSMLHDRVLADHAEVAHAMLYIGDHVRRLGKHDLKRIIGDLINQLAASALQLVAGEPHFFKNGQRFFLKPPFCQRNAQHAHSSASFTESSAATKSRSPSRFASVRLSSSVLCEESRTPSAPSKY